MTGPRVKRKVEPVIRLPEQHPGQIYVRENARRITIIDAGRRWRKTTYAMCHSVRRVVYNGEHIIWTAPTYDQVRIGWDEFYRACGGVFSFIKGEMVAEFPQTKGRVIFRSLDDPENARGHTADGIVMDEAAHTDEDAYYKVLRPMLMDTGGWVILMSTPAGRNWFWREFEAARDRADTLAVQSPCLGVEITPYGLIRKPHPLENPFIPFDELVGLYKTTPERIFRQEYLAEFVEDAGAVFRQVRSNANYELCPEAYEGTFVIGVDWGLSNDFTVLTVMDCAKRRVVDWDRFNQIDYDFQRERLEAMYRKWAANNNACSIVAEMNSIGRPNVSALQRIGLPIMGWTATNATKVTVIEQLSLDIEQHHIGYPPIPELLAELEAYELERLPSGLIRYSAPQGMHDDCVIALAIANDASRTPPIEKMEVDYEFTGGDDDEEDNTLMGQIRRSIGKNLKVVRR